MACESEKRKNNPVAVVFDSSSKNTVEQGGGRSFKTTIKVLEVVGVMLTDGCE